MYTVSSLLGNNGDDLWIFQNRSGGFTSVEFVSTGLVFGTSTVTGGRIDAVVGSNSDAWASAFDFVDITGMGIGDTSQLKYPGTDANVSSSWTIAPATPGVFVPEPNTMALTIMGLLVTLGFARRRKNK